MRRPSGATERLPGCGSAWNTAWRSSIVKNMRCMSVTSLRLSMPRRSSSAMSVTFVPGTYSMVRTLPDDSSGYASGTTTPGYGRMLALICRRFSSSTA